MISKKIDLLYIGSSIIFMGYLIMMTFSESYIFAVEKIILGITLFGTLTSVIYFIISKYEYKGTFSMTGLFSIVVLLMINYATDKYRWYMHSYEKENIYTTIIVFVVILVALTLFSAYRNAGKNSKPDCLKWIIAEIAGIVIIFTIFSGIFASEYNSEAAKNYYRNSKMIAAGSSGLIYIEDNGEVNADELLSSMYKEVKGWSDIIQVEANEENYYGLTSSGDVLACGNNSDINDEVKDWENITMLAVGEDIIAGLSEDGEIRIAGDANENDFSDMPDKEIKQIEVYEGDKVMALFDDGKVYLSGNSSLSNTSAWENVEYISGGELHILGLTKDGTVLADGEGFFGQTEVDGMKNVEYIYAGDDRTVLILANGDIFAVGYDKKISALKAEETTAITDDIENVYIYCEGKIEKL